MLGELPIEAEIHKRIFGTFGNIIRSYGSVEYELAWRQLSLKSDKSHSWFIMVKTLLELYELPSVYDLLQSPPGKYSWKNLVKNTVNRYWNLKLQDDARQKSSLKFLDIDSLKVGKTHLLWENAGSDPMAVTKATIKCRMLLGVYTLQANRHRFNQYDVEPICPLCKTEAEDRVHFIVINVSS